MIWVRITGRAIRGADDSTRFYEGTLEDVTERKLGDELLRAAEGAGLRRDVGEIRAAAGRAALLLDAPQPA